MRHDAGIAAGRVSDPELIELGPGAAGAWSPDGGEIVIVAMEGAVWITQTAGERDLILRRGEVFRSRGEGRVVVETITPSARLAIKRCTRATAGRSPAGVIGAWLGGVFAGRHAPTEPSAGRSTGSAPMGC